MGQMGRTPIRIHREMERLSGAADPILDFCSEVDMLIRTNALYCPGSASLLLPDFLSPFAYQVIPQKILVLCILMNSIVMAQIGWGGYSSG
jgi:hypothetical protein